MYTYEKKILFSDINKDSVMTVDGIMNAMQDCININAESIGRGIQYMLDTKRAWFAISWYIEIKRLPKLFESINVKTWPYAFSASLGQRNVVVTDENGEDILAADSLWTMMDMNVGRPDRLIPDDYENYELEPAYPITNPGRKIKLPMELRYIDEYRVRKSNIDFNGHMSNGEYIKLAYEYLPVDINVVAIRVEYKAQSKYDEILHIMTSVIENKHIIVMKDESEQTIKCVVEFTV